MKKLFLFLTVLLVGFTSFSQTKGYLQYDSLYLQRQGGNSELIILNATKDTFGFLVNKGNGRTEFRRVLKTLNDSTFIVGGDTLKTKRVPNSGEYIQNQYTAKQTASAWLDSVKVKSLWATDSTTLSSLKVRKEWQGSTYLTDTTTKNELSFRWDGNNGIGFNFLGRGYWGSPQTASMQWYSGGGYVVQQALAAPNGLQIGTWPQTSPVYIAASKFVAPKTLTNGAEDITNGTFGAHIKGNTAIMGGALMVGDTLLLNADIHKFLVSGSSKFNGNIIQATGRTVLGGATDDGAIPLQIQNSTGGAVKVIAPWNGVTIQGYDGSSYPGLVLNDNTGTAVMSFGHTTTANRTFIDSKKTGGYVTIDYKGTTKVRVDSAATTTYTRTLVNGATDDGSTSLQVNGGAKLGNNLQLGALATAPTASNGSVYYNTTSNTFQAKQNSAWVQVATCLKTSVVLDFPSIADNSSSILTATVTGAEVGDQVLITKTSGITSNGEFYTSYVTGTNTVSIRLQNSSGGTFDIGSDTYNITVIKF